MVYKQQHFVNPKLYPVRCPRCDRIIARIPAKSRAFCEICRRWCETDEEGRQTIETMSARMKELKRSLERKESKDEIDENEEYASIPQGHD